MAVQQAIRDIAAEVAKDLTVDNKTATPQVTAGTFHRVAEAEGLTADIFEKVADFKTRFVAGSALAVGLAGNELFSHNKSADRLDVTFNLDGKDKVDHAYKREATYPNPSDPGKTVTNYGVMRSTLTTNAGKNGGQLGAVYKELKDLAAEAFAKA